MYRDEAKKEFFQNNTSYTFDWILNIGQGRHVPIVNYAFDSVTDGEENQSIILRLYEPIPTNISTTRIVTIEEVLAGK